MTTPRSAASYGCPKHDPNPIISDPTGTVSAAEFCRVASDLGQLTNTTYKAWVKFPTTTSGNPTASSGQSHMGVGSGQLPTIVRTTTGTYTVTYPSSWTDDSQTVGGVGKTETISFVDSRGDVVGSTKGDVQTSESGSVVTAYVFNASNALSDLGGGVTIRVEAR